MRVPGVEMLRSLRSVLPLVLAAALPASGADAGAWTRAAGRGQLIVSSGREVAPVGALAGGIPDSDKSSLQVYVEYGVTDALTAGLKLYADISTTDPSDGQLSAGALLRGRVWQDAAGNVASVEVAGLVPVERFVSRDLARSNPDSTAEAGITALVGTGWWGDWGSAWTSAGAGWTWRSEGHADELRAEISAGYRPWRCCAAILAAYGARPLGGDGDASLKLAPSFAWTMFPVLERNDKKPDGPIHATTLQVGLSYDVLDADEGIGFQLAWWRPF